MQIGYHFCGGVCAAGICANTSLGRTAVPGMTTNLKKPAYSILRKDSAFLRLPYRVKVVNVIKR